MPNRLNKSLALFDTQGDYAIYEKLAKLWDEESHTWTEVERREFLHIHPKAYLSEVPLNPGNHALYRSCSTLPTMTFYRLIKTVYEEQDWKQRRWFTMLLDIHHDHPELQPYISAKSRPSSRTQITRGDSSRSISAYMTQRAGSVQEESAVIVTQGEGRGVNRKSEQPFSNSIFRLPSSQLRDENSGAELKGEASQQPQFHHALQIRHVSEEESNAKKRKHSTSDTRAMEHAAGRQAQEAEGDDDGDLVDAVISLKSQVAQAEGALEEVFIRLHQMSDEAEMLKRTTSKLSGRLDNMEEKQAERSRKIRRSLSGNY